MQSRPSKKNLLWFALFSVLATWSICAYSLVFTWMADGELFSRYVAGKPTVLDYLLFYEDAKLALVAKEKGINIYDPDIQFDGIKRLMAPVVPEARFYSHYPPPLFTFVIPFGLVPINWSYVIWNVIGLSLVFAGTLPDAYRKYGKTFPLAFAAVAVISSFPVWNCFELGQSSFFLLGGLALFFYLIRAERPFLAGLSIICLMIKVQYLPYAGLIGLVRGRFKFLAGAIVAVILTVGICILALGWDNCAIWPKTVLSGETGSENLFLIAPEVMQCVRGQLNLIFGADTSLVRMTSMVLCLISIIVVAFLWTAPYKKLQATSKYAFEIILAISLMLMLVFNIHTHVHDYCLFVWACLLCYIAASEVDENKSKLLRRSIIAFPLLSWFTFALKFVAMHFLHLQLLALYLVVVLYAAVKTLLLPRLKP